MLTFHLMGPRAYFQVCKDLWCIVQDKVVNKVEKLEFLIECDKLADSSCVVQCL
jgi:hypothetical protein